MNGGIGAGVGRRRFEWSVNFRSLGHGSTGIASQLRQGSEMASGVPCIVPATIERGFVTEGTSHNCRTGP